jgi:hypothetical protein
MERNAIYGEKHHRSQKYAPPLKNRARASHRFFRVNYGHPCHLWREWAGYALSAFCKSQDENVIYGGAGRCAAPGCAGAAQSAPVRCTPRRGRVLDSAILNGHGRRAMSAMGFAE